MDFFSVLETILDEVGFFEFAALFAIVAAIYYFSFRTRLHSLFDPLTYVLVFSGFTVVLLFILTALEVISVEKLLFAIATLVLYYASFLLVSSRRFRLPRHSKPPSAVAPATLAVLFLTNCVLLAITYVFFGVPLFLESRLSLWADAAGFGVIGRLSGGLEFIALLLGLIAAKRRGAGRRWGIALVAQFVVAGILSGSKGSLLSIVFAWYFSEVLVAKTWKAGIRFSRSAVALLAVLLASPLLTILLHAGGEAVSLRAAVVLYATRVAAEGDGYVYFFGGNLIDSIAHTDYLALFRPILTGLRLAPLETAINPGFEVMRQILSVEAPNAGPNSRLPIYILFFYGGGGLVLVPFLGALLGVTRNALLKASGNSLFRYVILASVYLNCTKIEVDPQITVNGLFNLLLVLPIIWLAKVAGESLSNRRPSRACSAMPSSQLLPTVPGTPAGCP